MSQQEGVKKSDCLKKKGATPHGVTPLEVLARIYFLLETAAFSFEPAVSLTP